MNDECMMKRDEYFSNKKNNMMNMMDYDDYDEYMEMEGFEKLRKELLNSYKKKQEFRVAYGKSKWINYESFDAKWNLREVLNDEIIIEFDTDDKNKAYEGINFTGINLYNEGISFSIWDHGGRSPHMHVQELPIAHLEKEKRALFKKMFIRKYVPLEYLDCVDYSLTGIHMLRIEWGKCFKNKYGIKILLNKFIPNKIKKEEKIYGI